MSIALYAAVPSSVPVIRCSPPSWAAQIALHEEGTAHDIHWLRFDRGEHRSPEMLRLHAGGTVPLLVDEGTVLSDTVAILEYIVARSPHQRLVLGPNSAARLEDAIAVKEAGMKAFRALMKEPGNAEVWPPLLAALTPWEQRLGSDAGLDVATLLLFVYAETARSLGFQTSAWPGLDTFLTAMRRRGSVLACWPDTWPRP